MMTANTDTISAVLPCLRADALRARLLLQSLRKYRTPIRKILLLCPSAQVNWFEEEFADLAQHLELQILDECKVVAELNECWWVRGWMKQQLLKLAVAHLIETNYFITLDADVVLTRDVALAELLPCGKAAYALTHPTPHMDWYRGSWRVLDVPARNTQLEHNITPAILSREGVLKLAGFLDERAEGISRSWSFRTLLQRRILAKRESRFAAGTRRWTLLLAAFAQWPLDEWTEYSLYYSFLEETGAMEELHFRVEKPLYDARISVQKKHKERFARVDWTSVFQQGQMTEEQRERPPFVIIQSVSNVSQEAVVGEFTPLLRVAEER